MRLDKLLHQKFPDLSRSFLQRSIASGLVKVNGRVARKVAAETAENAHVRLKKVVAEPLAMKPQDYPLEILFEDESILAINKPAGISVHPVSAIGNELSVVSAVLGHGKDLSGIGGVLRPGIVHRLDRDTSGVLIIAKTDKAHRNLSKQWENRTVKKRYLALVKGEFSQVEGKIIAPIRRDPRERKKMAVMKGGRLAETCFTVLRSCQTAGFFVSLCEARPVTGRTHQIRVHFSSIGNPIVGDKIYGNDTLNSYFEQHFALGRQFLHASRLELLHPITKKKLIIKAKLPPDLQSVANSLKLNP